MNEMRVVKPQTTLIVSLDLQHYIDADDDTVAALNHDAIARWRAAWIAAHPRAHVPVPVPRSSSECLSAPKSGAVAS